MTSPATTCATLRVYAGRITYLIGPQGSGKTTLLHTVAGQLRPNSGRLHYFDNTGLVHDLAYNDDDAVRQLRRRDITLVPHPARLDLTKCGEWLVAEPMGRSGIPIDDALANARRLLTCLGLPEASWSGTVASYDRNERQLVNLARGLASPARLLLLDEPLADLDDNHARRAGRLIQERAHEGCAILLAESLPGRSRHLADRIINLLPAQMATQHPQPTLSH